MYTTFEPRVKISHYPNQEQTIIEKVLPLLELIKLWNALPNNLKEERSLEVFKNELKYVEKLHRNVINLLLGPQGAES